MISIISVLVKASQTIKSENRTKELNNKSSIGKKCLRKVLLIRHATRG